MKKNKIIINIILTMVLFIVTYILKSIYDNGFNEFDIKMMTYIGVYINLYCIFSSVIIKRSIKSPYTLFQIFSILFLYGQLFDKYILNFVVEEIFDLSILVTDDNIMQGCFLIIFCELGLHFGFLMNALLYKDNINIKKKTEDEKIELVTIKKIGLILFAISVLPALVIFTSSLSAASISGYRGLIDSKANYGINAVFSKLIPFFEISLMLLMVGYKDKGKVSKCILVFSIVYNGIQLLGGNRGIPLIAIISFIWLYDIVVKKISKKVFITICILIIPVSSILNIIREFRGSGGFKEWASNLDELAISSIKEKNPIFETLYEIGVTIYPISYTIGAIPERMPYKYGKTYVLSILSIIAVNTDSSKNSLAYEMNIAAQMTKLSGSPFGGSYIQEAYANFGWYCPVFMIFIGYALEVLNKKIKNSNTLIEIILIAYFLNPLLWTVRNVLITLPREVVWYIIPTYLLYKLTYNKYKKTENERYKVRA